MPSPNASLKSCSCIRNPQPGPPGSVSRFISIPFSQFSSDFDQKSPSTPPPVLQKPSLTKGPEPVAWLAWLHIGWTPCKPFLGTKPAVPCEPMSFVESSVFETQIHRFLLALGSILPIGLGSSS